MDERVALFVIHALFGHYGRAVRVLTEGACCVVDLAMMAGEAVSRRRESRP